MTGSVNVPAFVYVREFDDTENPREHAITAFPDVTRPINLTAIPLRFGLRMSALMAVTANSPRTDFDLTTLHAVVVLLAVVTATSALLLNTPPVWRAPTSS
jgi:hypothetical protein